jgi:hypothetical protein
MKHTVTDLEVINEPSSSEYPILGSYSLNSNYGNFIVMTFEIQETKMLDVVLQTNLYIELAVSTTIVNSVNFSDIENFEKMPKKTKMLEIQYTPNI